MQYNISLLAVIIYNNFLVIYVILRDNNIILVTISRPDILGQDHQQNYSR